MISVYTKRAREHPVQGNGVFFGRWHSGVRAAPAVTQTVNRQVFPGRGGLPGWLGAPLALLLLVSCSNRELGTRHPMYVKGLRAEKRGDFEAAARAFTECVRMAPGNRPAHVHLGMIYEDKLGDPIAAMYHYAQGLGDGATDVHAELAQSSLLRVSRAFAATLLPEMPDPPTRSVETPLPVDGLDTRVAELENEREELLQQLQAAQAVISEQSDEIGQLRQLLADTEPPLPLPEPNEIQVETVYTVGKGDTLIGISRQVYGNGRYWRQLMDYNRDVLDGSELLKPGMKLRIPDLEKLQKKMSD